MNTDKVWPAWTWLYELEANAGRGSQQWIESDPFKQTMPYIHVEAARAWQALRDWLNGTPEEWIERCEQHFIDGQFEIFLGSKLTPGARRQMEIMDK